MQYVFGSESISNILIVANKKQENEFPAFLFVYELTLIIFSEVILLPHPHFRFRSVF